VAPTHGWSPVTLVENFRTAVAACAAALPGVELLPERLTRACAQVLPVDGAGISLFFLTDRRLPLGASDPAAAEAERLQFTVGEGPCLTSHAEGRPLVADEDALRSRWPAYYDALVAHTPIRGTMSLPLTDELRGIGALDLYVVPPRDTAALSLGDGLRISEEVSAIFHAEGRRGHDPADGPAWLDAPAAERRSTVWQAIGYLNAGLGVSSTDALALLRAHAYAEDRDVDDLARRLVSADLPLESFRLDADRLR
jgi:hypothetical protein